MGAGRLKRGSFKLAAVRTGPARSRGLRTQVIKPALPPGGCMRGDCKEGVSQAPGAEESGQRSSGVPAKCQKFYFLKNLRDSFKDETFHP
ncbi:Epididymis-Specific Alpha-Mannosidase [Manis pentadactyla]|nr:Epididymis-Specific Alpha-Mannosidase [Manis pentadactyla]